ncbi:Anti-sigma B factor RsbT [Aurantiacibacter atlanticus]|uniref:Anti-sigma B factor RsbT n=1 Tax=Aurantiacibacter atlanticus TaxID=1648404 RepID=A0A0H4VHH6_9SPHN|nr:Anti-sigma B factor RsbT [Aurantiacibacter atlanticus]
MIGWLKVEESSAVAEARRRTRRTANALGFDANEVEHAAIVATEIAQNVIRHGRGGRMLVEVFGAAAKERLQILGIDSGPGIERLDRMLKDGETSSTSLGTGLGAIHRLCDRMDVETGSSGTVISAEFRRCKASPGEAIDHSGFRLAYPGERRCGDAIAVRSIGDECVYFLCDGLGHGAKAADAADKARQAFLQASQSDPGELLSQIAETLAGTRGAVGAIVALDRAKGELRHAGIGNISTIIVENNKIHRISARDGLLGGRPTTPPVETVKLNHGAVLVMHSDGLSTLRGIERQSSLFQRSAPVIAGKLLGRESLKRDDASILVARMNAARSL